jgi:mannose-6-phosphate isomerase
VRPFVLEPNRPQKFYRGGRMAGAFRGEAPEDEHRPEEWLASVTPMRGGSEHEGLTRLPDGRWLRDAVLADPVTWLGPEHVEHFGADPALLVKLLDAGERLPVHLHPPRPYARQHLGSHYGKTEAWVVLSTEAGEASVWLGFRRDVEREELAGWVRSQQADLLLGSMHRLSVRAGDSVLVPAGLPHAIGAGMFCVEVQEPTDFSLNLEWSGFDLPSGAGGQLGLGFDQVLDCVRSSALTGRQLDDLRASRRPGVEVERVLPAEADSFFRVERVRPTGEVALGANFAVMIVVDGAGELSGETGRIPLRPGMVLVVPWASGSTSVSGPVEVLRCLPPESGGL